MIGDTEFPELPQLSDITDEESAWRALADVQARISMANRGILGRAERNDRFSSGAYADFMADLPDKLKKWLEKLYERLRKIITMIADATSFSITVGTTISVTVNFAKT